MNLLVPILILCKFTELLHFRRMEEAVDDLQHATHLCQQIVLGPGKKLIEVGE